jgi:stearoyl-CoA desaturase (Delta-9 desaturase)
MTGRRSPDPVAHNHNGIRGGKVKPSPLRHVAYCCRSMAAAADIEPVLHETRDRIITGMVTVLPVVGLFVAGWQLWNDLLHWHDVVAFGVMYVVTGLGVTIGFHRLLTHRAFETSPAMRGVLAALGSAAIEGPVVAWVADHRKHHAFADEEGDPHSPHVGHGGGVRGTLRGLWHAHVGWLFLHTQRANKRRYAPDLLADPVVRRIDETFLLWVAVGLLAPFLLGWVLGGSLAAALTGLLWGGLVRMFVVHHVTYSINSLCHVFGGRAFDTRDESRNVAWLAPFTFGESWHNNHHAFPTSAVHGLGRRQLDVSALVIGGLERLGLVWNVVRVPPERQQRRAL